MSEFVMLCFVSVMFLALCGVIAFVFREMNLGLKEIVTKHNAA